MAKSKKLNTNNLKVVCPSGGVDWRSDARKFFWGILVLCLILAFAILIMMLSPNGITGNVVSEGGSQISVVNGTLQEKIYVDNLIKHENFIKHIFRVFVESFEPYMQF